MVFDHASAHDDHARFARKNSSVIDTPDVGCDVDDETGILVRVEIDHIAKRAIGNGGAVDRDVVARAPVVDGGWFMDLEAEAMNHGRRGPYCSLEPYVFEMLDGLSSDKYV